MAAVRDEEFVRRAVQSLVQEALEAEMTEAIGAAKGGERTEGRLSYRSGYYGRSLITRVGTLGAASAAGSVGSVLDGVGRALPQA